MKNLYLIPTDKPSRLHNTFNFLRLESGFDLSPYNQHIHITNSEEIKEGDWVFDGDNPYKWTKDDVEDCLYNPGAKNYKGCKKIIMTTDQDLIKEGVQAIDDDFLEWFVENPSCEEVKVKPLLSNNGRAFYGYKIIIPQEEPKQIKCYCGHTITCDCGPLEETLEEAAEKYAENGDWEMLVEDNSFIRNESFKAGAKWQAERMYSEEEVFELLLKHQSDYRSAVRNTSPLDWSFDIKEWFNQFKKK